MFSASFAHSNSPTSARWPGFLQRRICLGTFGSSRRSGFLRKFHTQRAWPQKQLPGGSTQGVFALTALFWFFRRSTRDSSSSSRRRTGTGFDDGTNPYRELGVSESATFEEIQEAFEKLKIKYADDFKQLSKLEVLRDKIFDDKLRRRLQGKLEGIVRESPLEKRLRKQPWWKTSWLGRQLTSPGGLLYGIFKVPEKQYLRKTSIIMAILGLLGFFIPRFATSSLPISFITSMAFLYNRGQPEVRRDEFGNVGEVRPINRPAALKTMGLVFMFGGVGFVLAFALVSWFNIEQAVAVGLVPEWLQPASVVSAFVTLGMWAACTFFQVQPSSRT